MSISLSYRPTLIDRVVPRSIVSDIALVLAGATVTAVSAQIAIPMIPVPITGQTFAVLLVGSVLGLTRGSLALMLYFVMGAAGLPVFTGAASGITFGATFGYLVGFIFAAGLTGWLAQRNWDRKVLGVVGSFLAGNTVIYLFGLPWLSFVLGADLVTTLQFGLAPFIVGDLIKIAVAAALLPMAWRASKYLKH